MWCEWRAQKCVMFKINAYSIEQSFREFRIRPLEIGKIVDLIDFKNGQTVRSGYFCDRIIAACMVLRIIATPCRWHDLELIFIMTRHTLWEVFWEAVEEFTHQWGNLLDTFRSDLITERAQLYADPIKDCGATLHSCIGFIDCTKIRIGRPGGPGKVQRSCYSGQKRAHCLIYQTITTPDGLVFYMYGPEVGRR